MMGKWNPERDVDLWEETNFKKNKERRKGRMLPEAEPIPHLQGCSHCFFTQSCLLSLTFCSHGGLGRGVRWDSWAELSESWPSWRCPHRHSWCSPKQCLEHGKHGMDGWMDVHMDRWRSEWMTQNCRGWQTRGTLEPWPPRRYTGSNNQLTQNLQNHTLKWVLKMYCLNTRVIFLLPLSVYAFVLCRFISTQPPKSWPMGSFTVFLTWHTKHIPTLWVFLRIILKGCMVCRHVYKTKLNSLLFSSDTPLIFRGPRKLPFPFGLCSSPPLLARRLPIRGAPAGGLPACRNWHMLLPLHATLLQPTLCQSSSYLRFRAENKSHYFRKPSPTLLTALTSCTSRVKVLITLCLIIVCLMMCVHQAMSRRHFYIFFSWELLVSLESQFPHL